MDIKAHYASLNKVAADIQIKTFSDVDTFAALTKSHGYLHDLSIFYELLTSRFESSLFDLALKEYQFALTALSTGNYRHAFIGLRLFFEMMLAGILFSANEISYRLWARNEKDIVWNELLNEDKGVFSRTFCISFNEELKEHTKSFKGISEKVYRECSEYVHGNLHTHNNLTVLIEFKKDIFLDWHKKAESIYLVLLFLFCVRYFPLSKVGNHAKYVTLKTKIEAVLLSELGHIEELRNQF